LRVGGGGVPTLILPGSFFASAMTSASDVPEKDGWAISTMGDDAINPIGAKSCLMSKPRLVGREMPVRTMAMV
jgi:hypothetical protein